MIRVLCRKFFVLNTQCESTLSGWNSVNISSITITIFWSHSGNLHYKMYSKLFWNLNDLTNLITMYYLMLSNSSLRSHNIKTYNYLVKENPWKVGYVNSKRKFRIHPHPVNNELYLPTDVNFRWRCGPTTRGY